MVIGLTVIAVGLAVTVGSLAHPRWSEQELAALRALWIGALPPLPPDPSNRYGNDPEAAALGHKLFFDTRLSSNGEVACATCHHPEAQFQDSRSLSQGVGVTDRRSMTIVGTAYSPWLFWDGRKDSLWSQALGPLESPVEHGGDRTMYAHLMAEHYRTEYTSIFGPLPAIGHLPARAGPVADPGAAAAWETLSAADRQAVNRVFANIGKAIAAYERLIIPGPSRFDNYVAAVLDGDDTAASQFMSADEIAGLRLFLGKANCTECHNGPLFTDNHFHNTGVPAVASLPPDLGRALGAQQVLADEFNCLGVYSDASATECSELRFIVAEGHDLVRQFKPPTLRNVDGRSPYMHAGQFDTLEEVIAHYTLAPAAPDSHSELRPLSLTLQEQAQLVAFLKTLSGSLATPAQWLEAPQ